MLVLLDEKAILERFHISNCNGLESVCDTPLGLEVQRLLNVAAQKTFSALTELREKEARPSSRGPCHHSQLLGRSHPFPQILFVR